MIFLRNLIFIELVEIMRLLSKNNGFKNVASCELNVWKQAIMTKLEKLQLVNDWRKQRRLQNENSNFRTDLWPKELFCFDESLNLSSCRIKRQMVKQRLPKPRVQLLPKFKLPFCNDLLPFGNTRKILRDIDSNNSVYQHHGKINYRKSCGSTAARDRADCGSAIIQLSQKLCWTLETH